MPPKSNVQLGNFIRDSRRKHPGWSQKYVAGRLGVSEGTISRWESGRVPKVEQSIAIISLLEMSPTTYAKLSGFSLPALSPHATVIDELIEELVLMSPEGQAGMARALREARLSGEGRR